MTTGRSSSPTGSLGNTPHPLRNLAAYDAHTLTATAEQLLQAPHETLSVPSSDLLDLARPRQLQSFLKSKLGTGPSTVDYVFKTLGAAGTREVRPENTIKDIFEVLGHAGKKSVAAFNVAHTQSLLSQFDISRPIISLTEQERALFRAVVQMVADKQYSPQQWQRFLALLVWNRGKCLIEPKTNSGRVPELLQLLHEFVTRVASEHEAVLAEAARDAAVIARSAPHPAVTAALTTGAKWMSLKDLRGYATTKSPASLMIGRMAEAGRTADIYYDGHESLITIGGPGTGKSQAHVITNLLRYPGSAIVLDVKGELYQATAEYRARRFGPVYRFAPTDPSGSSDRYNPLEFIRTDPDGAADDLNIFAYQAIPENPKLSDPYWENKARDFLWAFAMMICLSLKGPDRTVESLYQLLSLQTDNDPDSDIMKVAASMIRKGQRTNIPDMVAAGNALKSGLQSGEHSHRIESILDTARRHFAGFNRASYVRKALSHSTWTPETFREKPGSTLYICMDSAELRANGAILRVIIAQHVTRLMKTQVKPTDVPITFFLDEMPQLGNFEYVSIMQDVGRGAGLRAWMFAQNMGQLARAFGQDKYEGLIDACRVRCFLQPDAEAATFLAHALGEVKNPFNGEKRPLATTSDLMGRAHSDHIIVTTRGDHPMALDRVLAYREYADRMLAPRTILKTANP
jgi:type IV secretion system protein VirD4